MNAQRKKSALKKLNEAMQNGLTQEEAIEFLTQDESKYSPEEMAEIEAALNESTGTPDDDADQDPPPDTNHIKPVEGKKDVIDLSGFDYKNLTGESFKKYVELVGDRSYMVVDKDTGAETPVVGKLKADELHDFQLFDVDVVMKPRYPGVQGTPNDFNGIKVKNDTPKHTTRIPVRIAHELNSQILNAHSRAGHGKYYLLKK